MKDNVLQFSTAVKPDDVLEMAKGNYDDVLIIGYDKDGHLDARSNQSVTHERANMLIDLFKRELLSWDYIE